LLEKELQWTGILAEPARSWHQALKKNRTSNIDARCVWSESGKELTFNETNIAALSTLDQFSGADLHYAARENGKRYQVETISLMDLLKAHDAPKNIDYLSIDTEGSEFDILNSFDFGAYNISIITCEHNYADKRKPIFDLLTSKGFSRVLEDLSGFEDWYVRN
jgi:FkbM family methyltransferase